MRTIFVIGVILLLGIALGAGAAVLRIRTTPWNPDIDQSSSDGAASVSWPDGPAPKVVVTETEFDFGALDMASTGSHEFVIANAGEAVLKLTPGGTSCRCAMSKLEREKISPGDSAKITITWEPTEQAGPYQQTATILTNDPTRPKVVLSVMGKITVAMQLLPPELVFSRVSVDEPSMAQTRLFCYLDESLKILGHTFSDPATAQYFEVATEPLKAEELAEHSPPPKSGMLVKVTVKPGLPQGAFRQKILFQTNAASTPAIALPIQGNVGSDIAVVGPGWNNDGGILNLGVISSRSGAKRRLMLIVRGPLRKEVEFTPASVVPSLLKVGVGRPSEINNGAVMQTPLTIEIPPGSPTVNCLGSEQGKFGKILLDTTCSKVPKLQIHVRFAVEE